MITDNKKSDYVTRDSILKLLSDDEVARVSTMETKTLLPVGEEYVNLDHPHQGVRRMEAASTLKMSQVLARSSVGAETWATICSRLIQ